MKKLSLVWERKEYFFAVFFTELRYRFRLGQLGKRCNLDIKRLIGGKHIFIGDYVTINWGARLEATTNYAGHVFNSRIVIGDNVAIGQNSHIVSCGLVEIGSGSTITAHVTIVDMEHPYEDIEISPRIAQPKCEPVFIGEECFISNGAVILPGTHLGKHCVVGANSVVRGQFGDFQIIAGIPARVVKKYDFDQNKWVSVQLKSKTE